MYEKPKPSQGLNVTVVNLKRNWKISGWKVIGKNWEVTETKLERGLKETGKNMKSLKLNETTILICLLQFKTFLLK